MSTPVEFGVERSGYEEEERCLVLEGAVAPDARVEAGMKLSLAVNRGFALELRIDRIDGWELRPGCARIAVRVRARSPEDAALLAGLDVRDELALVWGAVETVDPVRHFLGALEREVRIDLREAASR